MQKLILLFIFFIGFYFCVNGQITSSGITGVIYNRTVPIAGATVQAINTSNGGVYKTISQKNGYYTLPNLSSSGVYKTIFSFVGYHTDTIENINLQLGVFLTLNVNLKEKTTTQAEVVVRTTLTKQKYYTGLGTTITKENLERLPIINRTLQDFIKLSPQANGNSLAGSSYRYNNLSIDGAALNDAFGFTEPASGAGGSQATGSPGGLAKTQPISLEAIQEVQVQVSPYQVTLGNFTGGSINAITRSGSNVTNGSVFFTGRNQYSTGKSVDSKRNRIDNYFDFHTGGRLGGAIVKNKLFYFLAIEAARRSEPVPFAPGSEGTGIPKNIAQQLYDTVRARYNYDLGTYEAKTLKVNSNKFFGRIDWNINTIHKASLRFNLVNAYSDNLERSANVLNFESQGYRHNSKTSSTVFELKSNFSNKLSNNLIIGYTQTNDSRNINGNFFPHIEITYNTASTIFLGAYREAATYGLTLKTKELTNNLIYYKGKHTFTIGVHNEFYNIDYRFLTAFNGRWAYRSTEDFFANRPSRIRGVYNLTNNDYEYNRNLSSAKFRVFLLSEYLQDEIAIIKNMKLNLGIRLDHSLYPDMQPINAAVKATPAFSQYSNYKNNAPQISPRAGLEWDVRSNKKWIVKVGSGLFNGRIPFAWLAYPYYNSGTTYGNIDVRHTTEVPLNTNVAEVAKNLQPNIREINLLDNNFKLPKLWRSSISVHYTTKSNWKFIAEANYTKVIHDILYKTINLKDSTTALKGLGDNRPVYQGSGNGQKYNAGFTNVFLLTNTDKGVRYQLSLGASKQMKHLSINTFYTYGVSKDVANGVRVSPQANWEFNQTILPNKPAIAFSNFDIRHRTITSVQYNVLRKKQNTFITFIYTAQSGSPFTYTYIGDINRDGSPNNDLIYVPKNFAESNIVDIKNAAGQVMISAAEQWQNLNAFIDNDKYLKKKRGQYADRNGARTPWNLQLDMKISHNISLSKKYVLKTMSISIDIFNLSNLISKNWGKQYFVPSILNSSYQLLTVSKINTSNTAELNFNKPTSTPWQADALLSRMQGAVTVRYNF